MEDADGLILFVVGSVIVVALFLGVVTAVKKSFKAQPALKSVNTEDLYQQQRRRNEEINRQHQKMMDDLKQKQLDFQRRRN